METVTFGTVSPLRDGPQPVDEEDLVEGHLYDIHFGSTGYTPVWGSVALPFVNRQRFTGTLFFADGPNGIWVKSGEATIYDFEDYL